MILAKLGISDKILGKKGKLTAEEWEVIKSHPRLGANIVGNVPNLVPCVGGILYHHERWDGTGYPEGLEGGNIPIEARILAIADAYSAMTSARAYRGALCHEKVTKELKRGAGTQFDPELVEVFLNLIEPGLPMEVKVGEDSPGEQEGP
jgi:HD-GYP domain